MRKELAYNQILVIILLLTSARFHVLSGASAEGSPQTDHRVFTQGQPVQQPDSEIIHSLNKDEFNVGNIFVLLNSATSLLELASLTSTSSKTIQATHVPAVITKSASFLLFLHSLHELSGRKIKIGNMIGLFMSMQALGSLNVSTDRLSDTFASRYAPDSEHAGPDLKAGISSEQKKYIVIGALLFVLSLYQANKVSNQKRMHPFFSSLHQAGYCLYASRVRALQEATDAAISRQREKDTEFETEINRIQNELGKTHHNKYIIDEWIQRRENFKSAAENAAEFVKQHS